MSVQVQHRRDTNTNIEAVTPAVAELGYDATKKEALIGDGATAGGVRLQKKNIREILTPAQITVNQNDYSPTGLKHAAALVLTTDASRNVTGLVAASATDGTDGREVTIYNAGSNNLVLQDQNASSSAANRFDLGGADVTLGPKQSLTLRYRTQGSLNRWEVVTSTAGQGVADASISARKLATSALGGQMLTINAKFAESHAGNAVTFALKTLAGTDPSATDPAYFVFPDGSGGHVVRTVTAALSVVVSSGSSLGASNATPLRVWIGAIDDAGTVRLGVVNCSIAGQIFPVNESTAIGTTAEGGAGAADSAGAVYTTVAVTSGYFRLLAHADYDSGLATAGTWNASPTRIIPLAAGGKRPGDVVQSKQANTSTPVTTSSTSYLDTNLSVTITPTSPINQVRVRSEGDVSLSNGNGASLIALHRGATLLGPQQAFYPGVTGASVSYFPVAQRFLDACYTALSTTWKMRIKAGINTVTVGFPQTYGSMEVSEIMG
ncbi:hypothetical protein QWJ07_31235 [Frankia sp. RB7]|nr:hypothetical protein [Frankia sp. RB7]